MGPGRGSAAGAIVAYAMDITTFDPLYNGLMFERFLSPERTEMPDIDMDFDDERRLEVIEHVRQLYGEKVTHVITYSTIKAKQAINDAARVLDYPVYVGQRLSKMISSDPKVKLKQVLTKIEAKRRTSTPILPRRTPRIRTRTASSIRRSPSRASRVARACTHAPCSSAATR